jgi:hypothetical protein
MTSCYRRLLDASVEESGLSSTPISTTLLCVGSQTAYIAPPVATFVERNEWAIALSPDTWSQGGAGGLLGALEPVATIVGVSFHGEDYGRRNGFRQLCATILGRTEQEDPSYQAIKTRWPLCFN